MKMKRYKVMVFSTYGDEEENPEIRANNIEYPEIVRYVEDEEETFIVEDNGDFTKAREFFDMEAIDEFFVEE